VQDAYGVVVEERRVESSGTDSCIPSLLLFGQLVKHLHQQTAILNMTGLVSGVKALAGF
jgi:hypothetical protein